MNTNYYYKKYKPSAKIKKIFFFIWISFFTFTTTSVIYTDTVKVKKEKTYSLDDLVKNALSRSELIFAQKSIIEAKIFSKNQADAWQNPSLNFNLGQKRTSQNSSLNYDVSIFQPFYFPGKQKIRQEIIEMGIKMAGLSLTETKLMIRYEVLRLAYQYTLAIQKTEHAKERVQRFYLMRNYMRSRPFASPKKKIERVIVEKKLLIFQKELLNLQAQKEIVWQKLNVFLNFSDEVKIEAPLFKNGINLQLSQFLEDALKNNTFLKKQKYIVKRSKFEKKLAEKDVYPDFGFSAYYGQDNAQDKETFFGAGVTFVLPLFNRNQNKIKSTLAKIKSEKLKLQFKKRLVLQKIKAQYQEYITAQKIIKKLPISLLKRLHQQLRYADSEFRKGRLDLLTFLEIESQSYETHLAVFDSQIEFVENYITLLKISGSKNFQKEDGQNVK